jgi:predicted GNAT family N-acyltransferase
MKCIIACNQKHFYDQFIVRSEVFIIEQNVPIKEEIDLLDAQAIQFVAYDNEVPIGAARFRVVEGKGKVERVCVLKAYRKKKVGTLIMQTIENYALNQNITILILGAQLTALPFYHSLGFTEYGELFLDANIEHKMMKKYL